MKDFEFAVYSNQVIHCYFLVNLNLELKRGDRIQIQRDGDGDDGFAHKTYCILDVPVVVAVVSSFVRSLIRHRTKPLELIVPSSFVTLADKVKSLLSS